MPAETEGAAAKLEEACGRFAKSDRLVVSERREGQTRQVDVKEYVESCHRGGRRPGGVALDFRAKVGPSGTARPERIVQALEALSGVNLVIGRVVRTQIHLGEE